MTGFAVVDQLKGDGARPGDRVAGGEMEVGEGDRDGRPRPGVSAAAGTCGHQQGGKDPETRSGSGWGSHRGEQGPGLVPVQFPPGTAVTAR